ncbi:MAG: isochorismatase family cysteine hydrolase [bacterium]
MNTEAILVIDMVKGFFLEGFPLYCGDKVREIIPYVAEFLKMYSHLPVIYLCDHHAPDDKEFQMLPPHCIEGTEETELIEELRPYPGIIVPKARFSGLYQTGLEDILQKLDVDTVIIMGICTDISILFTAAGLRERDYTVRVPAQGVASFSSSEIQHFALKQMETVLGVKII